MSQIPRLHDATLEVFTFHWEEGIAHIRFSLGVDGTDPFSLQANGVSGIICPRRFPWGSSDSVNEVELKFVPEGQLLHIEMQSGDLIEITCKDIAVVNS